MWTETFDEQHKQGLEALTGGTKHRYYFNERKVDEGYQYDVVEFPHKPSVPEIKSAIIGEEHTIEDELKIIRKALSAVIEKIGAEGPAIDEFNAYNNAVNIIMTQVDELGKLKADEQPEGDYLNPIIYVDGMAVVNGKWYKTPSGYIWEAIKDGVPSSETDREYFDVVGI